MGNDANKDIKEFTENVVEAGNAAEDTTEKFEKLFESIQNKIMLDDNAFDDFDDVEIVHKISDELKEALYNLLNDIVADIEKSVTTDELNKKIEALKPKTNFAIDYLDQGQMQGLINRVIKARETVPITEANNIIAGIDEKTLKFTSSEQYNEIIAEVDSLIEEAQKSENNYLKSRLQTKRASLESDAKTWTAKIKKDELINPMDKKFGELYRFQSQLQGKADKLKKDLDVDAYLPEDIEKKQQQIKKDVEELQKYVALPIFEELEGYSDYVNKTVETGFKEIAELDRDVASELKSYGDKNAEYFSTFINSFKEQLGKAEEFLPDTKIDPGFGDFVKQVADLPKKMEDYKKAAGAVVKNVKTAEFTKLLDDATRKVQDSKAGGVNNTVDKSELQNTITELDDKFNSFDKALQKSFRSKYMQTRDKLSNRIGDLEKEEAKGGPQATSDEFEKYKNDIADLEKRVKRAIPKDIASLSNDEKAKLIKKLDKLGSDVRTLSNTSENFKKTILSGSIKNATDGIEKCNSALLNATKAAGGSIDKFVENAVQLNKRAAQLEKSAAAEDLRKTINREIKDLASTKLTDSYKSRYEKLITARKAIKDKARELETGGKLSKDEIESRTSATLKAFEKEIYSVSGELIRSYFKDNIAGAKAAIDALGDKEKISKLDAPDEIKDILSEAEDGPGELSDIINRAYEDQVAQAKKDAIDAAKKELDELQAKKDLAKGTFERSKTEENGNNYLKALEAYRAKMDEVPEGTVKEDEKATVTNEIEKLKEALKHVDELVTEKIAELTQEVNDAVKDIKSDKTLSTGEKVKKIEEQAKKLEGVEGTTGGDKEALKKIKDSVQHDIDNLLVELIKEQARKKIDALKAEAVAKEGDFKRSGSRQDAELALKAYSKLYAEMEKAPEDVVSETDKARVQNKMKDLEDAIEEIYHAVTAEIDELTKDVSKTISNIKQDRTLSTKQKIDAVQGQLGRLEEATPVSTGDVKALEDSKDATQRALSNLQAQYADEQTRAAKQATQQVLSSVKSIVSGIERAMNSVVSIIRRGLSLLNRAINFTINSLKSVITGAQKIIQLVGSLSNRVRSFVGNLLHANKAGERSNVIIKSVGLTFTELNSILSLAERGFNALFNNQMLERALKFDSTIASITMLLGKEAVQDVREFAGALEKGFGIPATKTISDLQEISSLLKGVGLETKYIANASEDLYSMANYMAALGMAGGDVSEAMSKLQSGMKGMTNSIDDLGISMRKEVLNEFLKNKGVDVKFSNLSETNRDIVRLASIIEQFKRGFNIKDYPTLLGQTYFRISLIKSQVEQIGTLLGKLWEGIIAKILPYIMKVVAVLKQGILSIGEFLHIDMDGKQIEENIESVANATDDVTKATEKAKKAQDKWTSTAGFDQIESLNSSKSGSGENDQDLSWLLDDVGGISDMLQKLAEDSDGFMDQLNKEIDETLSKIKAKIQEFVDSLLGHHVDLSFGFDKKQAKKSIQNIWKNVSRWWKSFAGTGLYLGLRFAEDFQIGRFVNDVLGFVDSLTLIGAVIQEQLEPIIKNFYDKYVSQYVTKAGNKIHKLQLDFERFSKVFEEIFDPSIDDTTLQKHIDRLKEYSPTLGDLADKINIVKKNWKGFLGIWYDVNTDEAKTLRETIPLITEIEDTIKSVRDLLSTLWGDYIKPLLDNVNNSLPGPEEALQDIQNTLDSITSYLSSDVGQITIKDSASDVLDIIQTKVDTIKSSLAAAGEIGLSLITPTDENGKVTSEAAGGTSVLSLLADDNRDFYENEFKPWIDGISAEISNFIVDNKDDIAELIGYLRDFAWDMFKLVVEAVLDDIEWLVNHKEDVKFVLDEVEKAFGFLLDHSTEIIAVMAGLKLAELFSAIASIGALPVAVISGIVWMVTSFTNMFKTIGTDLKNLPDIDTVGEILGAIAEFFEKFMLFLTGGPLAFIGSYNPLTEWLEDITGKNKKKESWFGEDGKINRFARWVTTGESSSGGGGRDREMPTENKLTSQIKDSVSQSKSGPDYEGYYESLNFFESLLEPREKTYTYDEAQKALLEAQKQGNAEDIKHYQEIVDSLARTETIEGAQRALLDAQKRGNIEDIQYYKDIVSNLKAAQEEEKKSDDDAKKDNAKNSDKVKSAVLTMNSDMKDAFGKIQESIDEIKTSLDNSAVVQKLSEIRDQITVVIGKLEKKGKKKVEVATDTWKTIDGTRGGLSEALHYAENVYVKPCASGGSIGKGNLFIANENGTATELIGNITRKSGTDVANNKMITDAMETAVYNGFADAFNQMQSNNGVGSRQQQTINISGFGMIDKNTLKKLAQLLAPYLDANDKSLITT